MYWTNLFADRDFKTAQYLLCLMVISSRSYVEVYNVKQQVGQKEDRNVEFEEKKSIWKFNVKAYAETERLRTDLI